ncbi:hypothetical protein AV530_003419 [Patagioenas fasciata monilis]|uniref:Uncharacterized protein n=1 Tax=Patagioenas fasciata monilis TaxID=372326 RepID=A0A1V4K2P8_PATFA|nr:hypothetical protein AV530_003419 [Patagioenas fasciata monilis]
MERNWGCTIESKKHLTPFKCRNTTRPVYSRYLIVSLKSFFELNQSGLQEMKPYTTSEEQKRSRGLHQNKLKEMMMSSGWLNEVTLASLTCHCTNFCQDVSEVPSSKIAAFHQSSSGSWAFVYPLSNFRCSHFLSNCASQASERESVINRYRNCLDSWNWKEPTAGQSVLTFYK